MAKAAQRGPLGQPWWVWGVGLAAVAVGYWYFTSRSAGGTSSSGTSGSGTTATSGSPTGLSWEQFLLFLHDQQGSPSKTGTKTSTGGKTPPPARKPARKPPQPKKKAKQPPILSNFYTVRPGDTLASVAKRFGISRVQLAHANGLGTGAGLRTGQRLRVPGPLRPRSKGGPG